MRFKKIVRVGGAAEIVDPKWDEENEFEWVIKKALLDILSEARAAGLVKITPMGHSGDFRVRAVEMDIGE